MDSLGINEDRKRSESVHKDVYRVTNAQIKDNGIEILVENYCLKRKLGISISYSVFLFEFYALQVD